MAATLGAFRLPSVPTASTPPLRLRLRQFLPLALDTTTTTVLIHPTFITQPPPPRRSFLPFTHARSSTTSTALPIQLDCLKSVSSFSKYKFFEPVNSYL